MTAANKSVPADLAKYTGEKIENMSISEFRGFVLYLSKTEGMSQREIAALTGRTNQAIGRILKRMEAAPGRRGATRIISGRSHHRIAKKFAEMAQASNRSVGSYHDLWMRAITEDPVGATRFLGKMAKAPK
ncbi:hypothetical protein ACETRX_03990 [Labrys portucalensis]|uniref:MarR family transcriptional regulator n=1 Tax=Labrys neptuniae TaxID=376174 RepID=A0ABV6Z9D8_9HYPH